MALYLKKVSLWDFNQCHKISTPYLFEKTFLRRIFYRIKKICLMLTWSKEEFMWFRLVYQEYNFGIVINKIYVPFQMWQIVFYKQKLANFLSQTASKICLYPFHFSSYRQIAQNLLIAIHILVPLVSISNVEITSYFLNTRWANNNWFNCTLSNSSEVSYLTADMVSCLCGHNHSNLRVGDH